jgi:solute carrier family 35 protein C2
MGLSAGTHHRRRSSMLAGTGRASQPVFTERRDESHRLHDGGIHTREEQEPLTAGGDTDASDISSAAESLELDPMTSDDDQYDEETGLTTRQKRQRRRRRKQRRKLDARIADVKGHGSIREILSDRNIVKRLLINGGLILMWYFFSLSISIVSDISRWLQGRVEANYFHVHSTTNGCSPKAISSSLSLFSQRAYIWLSNSLSPL